MRSINPTCKFIGTLLPGVLLALYYLPALNLAVFAACVAGTLSARVSLKSLLAVLLPALLVAAGMFMTAYQFSSDTVVGAHRDLFSDGRVYNGLLLSGRVLAFSGLGALFVLTTDPIEFIRSLNQQLKLPASIAYSMIAVWGILPKMRREYAATRAAFRARGLRVGFISAALLIPLLVKSARWSEALACAMESKGFSDSGARTHYHKLTVGAGDIAFLFLTGAALILTATLLSRL